LNALVEQEALEKQFFLQQQQLQQQQQQLQQTSFLRGFPGQPGLPPSSNPIGQVHPGRPVSASPPVPAPENQAFLNFMSQKQKMEESVGSSVVKPVVVDSKGPIIATTSDTADTSTSVTVTATTTADSQSKTKNTSEKKDKSPSKKPIPPSDEPAAAVLNKEVKQMHISEPTVVSETPVASVAKKDEGKKREKGPARRVSQVQAEMAANTSSVTATSPIVEQSEQSVPVVKKATPAPWATKVVPSGSPVAKVSEIQEKEQANLKVREKKEQEVAQARVIAEASVLKKEALNAATGTGLPGQWASGTSVPTNNSKKTLAQIMEDEAKLKAAASSAPTANVPKGYAASVAANTSTLASPKTFAAKASAKVKVAKGPVVKPAATNASSTPTTSGNDGWSVVGKGSLNSASTASLNATANVPDKQATPKKNGGVSDSFKSWYRKALLPVSKATSLNGKCK
jgi:hypothetical protein